MNELTGTGEADRRAPAYNPNPCYHCKEIGHFRHDCPLLNSPVPVIAGKLHHTLDVETPVGKEMLDDFLSKLLQSERRGAKLLAKLHKERATKYSKTILARWGTSNSGAMTPNRFITPRGRSTAGRDPKSCTTGSTT